MHPRSSKAVAVVLGSILLVVGGPGAQAIAIQPTRGPAIVSSGRGAPPPASPTYLEPVDAPVVELFRPPAQRWSPGNRGIDFGTPPGTSVSASADGEVVFAGPVGGSQHVVVLHADGLRTSYSFLRSVTVRRGQAVRRGDPVGVTAGPLHFGVRAGEEYLDPLAVLLGPPVVHLVPESARTPDDVARERGVLARHLRGVGSLAGRAASWARDRAEPTVSELRGILHYAFEATSIPSALRIAEVTREWSRNQESCTPAAVSTPRLVSRRLAVLVGGLGSTSEKAAIDDVDTAVLGYAPEDVYRFSYKGGSTRETVYAAEDTTVDLRTSARRLRELLAAVGAANPGVPIDLLAHSQGGVVAQAALTNEYDRADLRLPTLGAFVSLGSPHRGADLATAAAMVGRSSSGELAENILARVLDVGIDPGAVGVKQLAETSSFIRDLRDRPLPQGLNATAISASGDAVVPAGRSRLVGARNTTLALPGIFNDHSELPGSPQAQREIALALAGLAPTCQALEEVLTGAVISEQIARVEDMAGAALWAAGRRYDRKAARSGPRSRPR